MSRLSARALGEGLAASLAALGAGLLLVGPAHALAGGAAVEPPAGDVAPAQAGARPPAGLPGFQGSDACSSCHAGQYHEWENSSHARTIHAPSKMEKDQLSRSILCGEWDAQYILGERHARRFLIESEAEKGMHVMLPCRYDIGPAEWANLHAADWKVRTWEKGCGACHATGFSSDSFTYSEMKVGCEACHGPARLHGPGMTAPGMISFKALSAKEEATICAQCHLQGGTSRRTGLSFPSNFEAGGDLFADYQFDWASLDPNPEKSANPIDIHQKLLIKDLVTNAGGAGGLRCTSCHQAHMMGHEKHEKLPRQDYCHLCHAREDFKVKEYNQACNVCEF